MLRINVKDVKSKASAKKALFALLELVSKGVRLMGIVQQIFLFVM